MDNEIKREIILDNFNNPFNKDGNINLGYEKINSNNESCIDDIDLYIDIKDNIIKDIRFNGEACAISTSSTSIMLKNIIGKNVLDAYKYVINFMNMVEEKEYDEKLLGEGIVFNEIYKQQNRKTCVTLPYTGILKILEKYI
ncbi:MAG: SUF system NifU family Fe-S cluster assembly protein [Bacilli bacterium]|nr:SUF system NifU family Fe-S cluster assembly protein [Bacilli bacterium]